MYLVICEDDHKCCEYITKFEFIFHFIQKATKKGKNMLIQFTVGNFLSFKEPVTLSMVAATSKKELQEHNLIRVNKKLTLVKSAVIYGANASGKSNLISALGFMSRFVSFSLTSMQPDEKIKVHSFRLDTDMEKEPSLFEVVFFQDGIRYRYGFQVDKDSVRSEWLFYVPAIKEIKLFIRKGNNYEISPNFKEGNDLKEKTRKNALFLTVAAQFNGTISTNILKWFENFNVISGLNDRSYIGYTKTKARDTNFKKKIVNFLKNADLNIEDIVVEKPKDEKEVLDEKLTERRRFQAKPYPRILTIHKKYGKDGKFTNYESFDLDREESEGTKKFFGISGPIINTIENGRVLVIDELDARLHPKLTKALLSLFNSRTRNTNNAQLIFVTHDTKLLNIDLFRRDQIWFTVKNKYGATDLYSLIEYSVRKDASFEKDYLLGKYGAVPFIKEDNFTFRLEDGDS